MLGQLLIAGLLLAVCVLIHAFGTLAVQKQLQRRARARPHTERVHPFALLVLLFVLIFALHALEVVVWAVAYWLIEALPTMEEAVYFSLSSYTTVGYGDVVLGLHWRILGAAEAAVGVLLLGWSTALLFGVIQHLYQHPD